MVSAKYAGSPGPVAIPPHECVDVASLADKLESGDDVVVLCCLAYGLAIAPGLVWAISTDESNWRSIDSFFSNLEGHTMGVASSRPCTHPGEYVSLFLLLVRGCAVR